MPNAQTPAPAPKAPSAPDVATPAPTTTPSTIIFKDGQGKDVTINVDGKGIHLKQGTQVATIPLGDVVPSGVVDMVQAVAGASVAILLGLPIVIALARRLARPRPPAAVPADLDARLSALERNIDTVAIEVERVSEAQRFTAKLLESRSPAHAQHPDR